MNNYDYSDLETSDALKWIGAVLGVIALIAATVGLLLWGLWRI